MAEQHIKTLRNSTSAAEDDFTARVVRVGEIFFGLSAAEVEAIINLSKDEKYASGDYIYRAEERQRGLFLLKKGRVEEFRLMPGGQRLPISQIGPRQFFGVATGQESYCCFAVAAEDSVVGFFPFEQLERIFQEHPTVGINLVHWFSRRLGEMEERIQTLAFRHLRARVARVLLDLSAAQNSSLVEVTQEALSEWVSASRTRVSLVLQELRKRGVIHLSRGKIQIGEPAQLKQWAEEAV